MNPLAAALQRVVAVLTDEGTPFALVGGLAVSVRTEPRFTRDIDLAVAAADDLEAEALVRRLSRGGWQTLAVIEQDSTDRLAAVRFGPPADLGTAAVVDLLFASSGIERELARDAERLEVLPDLVVPVASIAGLIVLKALAAAPTRPQDTVDLSALAGVATPADIAEAERLAELVVERGFGRERDLVGDVRRLAG